MGKFDLAQIKANRKLKYKRSQAGIQKLEKLKKVY